MIRKEKGMKKKKVEEVEEDEEVEDNDDDPGGFRACSEVELARNSTGAEVFAALKGAVHVGLNVPHSEKRLPGYDSEAKSLKADVYRASIFRQHMADYMRNLSEENEEDKYEKDDEEEKEEKDECECGNEFFVSYGYPSDEGEEEDEDEEVEDNDDDPGESRACLDVELAKGPRSPVTKLPRRVVAKLPGNAKK